MVPAPAGAMGLVLSSLYSWFTGGQYKIVMVGLDNAGKTTILYRLCARAELCYCHDTCDSHPK